MSREDPYLSVQTFALGDIERETLDNQDFRRVAHVTPHMELTYYSINKTDARIPEEIHPSTTQFIRVEAGRGYALLDDMRKELRPDTYLIVFPGTRHEIVMEGSAPLKLYSIYAPPVHPVGLVQQRRLE